MGLPVIAYDNKLVDATLSVTSEASGYPKENAVDGLTWDWWKPTAAGTVYFTADMGAAIACDVWSCFAHNLASVAGSIQLQYSSDNFAADINNAGAAVSPSDTAVIFRTFASVSARYWRFEIITTGQPAAIGALFLGPGLTLPEGMPIGFVPPTLSFEDDITNQRTHGGAFLGRSVLRRGAAGELSIIDADPAWMRATWAPFLAHAQTKTFFLSWDPDNYPAEAAFCWTSRAVDGVAYTKPLYMSHRLSYEGLTQ